MFFGIPLPIAFKLPYAVSKPQAQEQKLDDLERRLSNDLNDSPSPWPVGWPGSSMLTPTGYNGTRGMLGLGVGLQPGERQDRQRNDGLVGIVLPVGDPVKSIGLDLIATADHLADLSKEQAFDFVVHKRDKDFGIAFGTERLVNWGTHPDSLKSYYLVGSQRFRLKESSLDPFSRVTVSLGVGSGRYQREKDAVARKDGFGVFGSCAINVTQQANAFAEWTGQDLDLGVSFSPLRNLPLVISAAAVDVAGTAGSGVRASFGLGYVYRFR